MNIICSSELCHDARSWSALFSTLNTSYLSVLPTVEMLRMTTCCSPIFCRPCCLVWRETQRTRWCPDRSTALWYEGSWARSIRTRIRIWNCCGSLLFCNNSGIRKQRIALCGKPKLSKLFFLDFFAQCVTVDHFSRTQASPEEPLECIAPFLSALNTYHFTCYETNRKIVSHGMSTRPELYILNMKADNFFSKTYFQPVRFKVVHHSPTAFLR